MPAIQSIRGHMVSLLPMVASCNDLINRRNKLITEQCDGKSNSTKLDELIEETAAWLKTHEPMKPEGIARIKALKQSILDDIGRRKCGLILFRAI